MGYTLVRGGAIIGLRLCANCKDNLYEQDLSEKPKCEICNHAIMDGIAVTICRICSLETCVCQQCGAPIPADDEVLKEKRKRKKGKSNVESNLPVSDHGQDPKPDQAGPVVPPSGKVEAIGVKPSIPGDKRPPSDH